MRTGYSWYVFPLISFPISNLVPFPFLVPLPWGGANSLIDVSANGDNIAVFNGGNYTLSGGTSASTPIFASVVTRINEERLKAAKGAVGFLNPSLYANPGMLNDIVNGTNPGSGTVGFSAVPG
jgi:Ca2+-binding RTX toxin-like protein